jgi:hypothetical protein
LQGPVADPVVSKYISSGLSREAVPLAVANYGDNPTKVSLEPFLILTFILIPKNIYIYIYIYIFHWCFGGGTNHCYGLWSLSVQKAILLCFKSMVMTHEALPTKFKMERQRKNRKKSFLSIFIFSFFFLAFSHWGCHSAESKFLSSGYFIGRSES